MEQTQGLTDGRMRKTCTVAERKKLCIIKSLTLLSHQSILQ